VKRSNRLVILVGVLLAVLAFVLVVVLLNNQSGSTQAQELKTKVLVATQDIAIGDAVTPDMVKVLEVDPNAVVGKPLHDPSQVGGRAALVNVPKDSQVSEETFGVGGTYADIAKQLKTGEKAIALQVDRTTGLDFLVQPGNIVDVVLATDVQVLQPTADSTDKNPRFEPVTGLEAARTVKTVLQQKRVLYVSQSRQQVTAATASASPQANSQQKAQTLPDTIIIVIAGTDQDAELLRFAQKNQTENGVLGVTIRATDDTADEKTTGVTIDLLVKNYGLPIPGIVQEVGPSAAP
jgi:Flp pilus assembly protein CpaB